MRALCLTVVVLGLWACAHEAPNETDDAGVGADGGSGEDLSKACPSNILCGAGGACCAEGEECVEEACMPACATGVRCASTCCPAGDVCLSGSCVAPTTTCTDSFQCAEGEFCEPTIGKCLPQPMGASLCEYRPPVAPLAPVIGWSWTASVIQPEFGQVINTPVVADLDKDQIPDVVIVTSKNSGTGSSFGQGDVAYLRALDGKTGLEKWGAGAGVYQAGNEVNPRGTPALGDLDGDGTIEIVAPRKGGGAFAFNGDGSLRWRSKNANDTDYNGDFNSVTVAIADMNHDGKAEIVLGGVVLDHTGHVISGVGREHAGENASTYGAVSIVADIDDNGVQDVVTGKAAYDLAGNPLWDCGAGAFCGAPAALKDGYPAIADLDKDGKPELVVISSGEVRVQDAKTGTLKARLTLPGSGSGGPPTIADFNGDKVMDFASANGTSYNVFTYTPTPTPTIALLWGKTTQDGSSNVTGSSVFDFEGDGKAEVVYNDECYLRIYNGADGNVLFQTPSSSATIHEFPILVDVDGDNHTELVVVSNDRNHNNGSPTCPDYVGGEAPRHGVFVYRDSNNKWVRTRRLWNQHAYHVTNINTDGKLPNPEAPSWVSPPGLNNYRVSTQGAGVFNAPDLRVDLEISTQDCPASLLLRARVKNVGSLGVAPGVAVAFFLGADAGGTLVHQAATTTALLPGQSEVVTYAYPASTSTGPVDFFVVVDGSAQVQSTVPECAEDNNGSHATGIQCNIIL